MTNDSTQSEATIAQPGADTGPALDLGLDTETDDHPEVYPGSTLVLVGCGKAKRDPEDPVDVHEAAIGPDEHVGQSWQGETGPAWRAEDLYTSTYFSAKREFAETVTRWNGDPDSTPWAILSAEHKVLFPWEKVTPYDTTIEDIGDDPLEPDDRVAGSCGRLRPDGQEIVTEMDKWATGVAYGLASWLSMFRESQDMPHTTRMSTLLVLAGQSYIEPLRERGVFEYGISRMAGDPNDIAEFPVDVRFLFEEIDAEGIGEQMAYLSDVVARHETDREPTEQAGLVDSMTATGGGEGRE